MYGSIAPMTEQCVIVWDLETVPDLTAAARMFDMGDATEADVLAAKLLGQRFLSIRSTRLFVSAR